LELLLLGISVVGDYCWNYCWWELLLLELLLFGN
jgi:hypothetical protein